VSLAVQSAIVLIATVVAYFLVGTLLAMRGMLIRAGLAMLAISWLPLIWQVRFTDSDSNASGVLLVVMAPIPVIIIALGIISALVRLVRKWTTNQN